MDFGTPKNYLATVLGLSLKKAEENGKDDT